ncbi:MAG TPA: Ig-like domain-containing protein, partial [Polyangiaceae bacterium]|nr:Ig-like domain-containing protein [Polyangiaceae bacterium]
SGTTNLTVSTAALVSIAITPANQTVANGTKIQYRAIGTYTDASEVDITANSNLSWNSTGGATVSNGADKGLASTNTVGGPFNITATWGSGMGAIVGTTALTVTAATLDSITVAPVAPATSTIARGTTVQFQATGHYSDATSQVLLASEVNWGSNNPAVATVSNAVGNEGLATGVSGPGIASITASVSGVTGSITLTVTAALLTSITVNPANGTVILGATRQFIATGNYADTTTQDITQLVLWGSTNLTAATISNGAGSRGVATALATGVTTITATMSPGTPGSTMLTVTP